NRTLDRETEAKGDAVEVQAAGFWTAGSRVSAGRLHCGAQLSPARSLHPAASRVQGERRGYGCAAAESEWRHMETGHAFGRNAARKMVGGLHRSAVECAGRTDCRTEPEPARGH